MKRKKFCESRKWCVGSVHGTVLELGFGAGANLDYYPEGVGTLYALEPSIDLYKRSCSASADIPVVHVRAVAESIPLPDASQDFVVSTWTLCSVIDIAQVVREIKRVLKPTGQLRFVEHGKSNSKYQSFLQRMVSPIWKSIAGGCVLDREYFEYFEKAGFNFEQKTNEGSTYFGVASVI
jgi:ubiquinone/menaquinone biosynthesis C-methylase UbiE